MDVSPSGNGDIKVDENIPSSYPSDSTITSGTQVNLKAVPAPGYRFTNWSGDLSGTTNPTTLAIDCTKSITANFSQAVHTLTMQLIGDGSTTPTVGTHDYAEGTVVSITTTPDSGWQFDSWNGAVTDPGSATTTLTMDSDKTITANLTSQVRWPWVIGSLALAGLLVITLIFRRTED